MGRMSYLLGNTWRIFVGDNKLRRALQDETARKRQYGAGMADKLRLRLAALESAKSLADFWPPKSGPERCHELIGQRVGVFFDRSETTLPAPFPTR